MKEEKYYKNRPLKNTHGNFSISQDRLDFIIFDILNYDKNQKYDFLELGCGMGKSLFYLAKKYPNINFYGLEINKNEFNYCIDNIKKQNIKNMFIYQGDATLYNFDKEFDFVFSEQVIEHVKDQKGLIKNMILHLKLNRKFFISCPNYNFPIEQHLKLPITYLSKENAIKLLRFMRMYKGADFYKYVFPLNQKKIYNYLVELGFKGEFKNISNDIPYNKYTKNKYILFVLSFFSVLTPSNFYTHFFPWIGIVGINNKS